MLEAGTAETAPKDRWKHAQRPHAGCWAQITSMAASRSAEKGGCAGEGARTTDMMVVRAGDDAEGRG